MANLTDPRWIWFKGGLFVVTGGLAALVLIANSPRLQTIGLLAIAIWSFCRAYYFAFYVIERYIDPKFSFSGLLHFARYALLGHSPDETKQRNADTDEDHDLS
ncbi:MULTISPECIES: hypothetical protein [Rhodopirellula]|uniref:hypothetical protein n=1 Tax=Rhodopirellula TaxID=265488 RepID=UPI00257FF23D|nr:hypothetical protein [Rhodopirellula sp. UBA1907]